ncbi:MAG: hypothetical protein ACLP1E_04120 [Acidimicrobiales bacterium]
MSDWHYPEVGGAQDVFFDRAAACSLPAGVRETAVGKLLAAMIVKCASIPAAVERLASPRLPRTGTDHGAPASRSLKMRSPRSLRAALVTSLLLAGMLAACSQVQARATRATLTPSRAVLVTLARHASLSRHQLAQRDAARLLNLVRLPPGSKRLAQVPGADARLLSSAAQSIGDPNLVELHRFFVVAASPWKLYRYERSHPPLGSTSLGGYNGFGTSNTYGTTDEWFVSYSWLPVKSLLDARVLVISIAALPERRSAVRVDAQVTWLPAKPAGDRIPGGAKVLTAVLSAGMNSGEPGHPPVTTTDPAKIEAIRDFINQLGVIPPGVRFCPIDFGQHLTISFRKDARTRPFAVVVADVAGCEDVQVQRFGHVVKPGLSGLGLVPFVERELGFTSSDAAALRRLGTTLGASTGRAKIHLHRALASLRVKVGADIEEVDIHALHA